MTTVPAMPTQTMATGGVLVAILVGGIDIVGLENILGIAGWKIPRSGGGVGKQVVS